MLYLPTMGVRKIVVDTNRKMKIYFALSNRPLFGWIETTMSKPSKFNATLFALLKIKICDSKAIESNFF